MMNTFCFVGLDIGHYNIACTLLMRRKTSWLTFSIKQTHQDYQQLIDKLLQLKAD